MSGRGRYGGRGAGHMAPRQSMPVGGNRPQGGRGYYNGGQPARQPQGRAPAQPARTVQQPRPSARMNPYPSPQAQSPQQHQSPGGKGKVHQPNVQPQAAVAAMDHSFSLKVRSLVDHRIRTPHRRSIHPQLHRSVAHWVTLPVHTVPLLSQHVEIEKKKDLESATVASETPATTEPTTGAVNARVLLCPGLVAPSPGDKKPVLSRLSIFAGKRASGGVEAYGGIVETGESLEEVPAKLVDLVKSQSGLDLSAVTTWYKFLELNYADNPVPTVFFLPALWEVSSELVLAPLVREETIEKTETVEPQIDKEGMTDEEFAAAKAEAKPETRTVTEVKKILVTVPISLTFAELQTAEVNKNMSKEVLEFYAAADALDEFVKREMATRIVLKLKERAEKARERAEKQAAEQAVVADRKRKREEKISQRKARKQAKLDDLAAMWELEDQGKTDDEKREALAERQAAKKEILEAKDSEDEEEPEEKAAAPEPKKGKFRTVAVVDQASMDAFEYFDRPATMATKSTGFLTRTRLENLLLLTDDQLSLAGVEKILQALGRTQSISYRPLSTEYHQEEIPEEPKPEEKPEEPKEEAIAEEEKKEEAAAPAEGETAMETEAEAPAADTAEDDDEPPTVDA